MLTILETNLESKIGLYTLHKKMKLSEKDFFSKCDEIRCFPEEILNGKLLFLFSAMKIFIADFLQIF